MSGASEYFRAYHAAHREERAMKQKARRAEHGDELRARRREWYRSHKDDPLWQERRRAVEAKSRMKHAEEIRARDRARAAQHKEYYAAQNARGYLRREYGLTPDDYARMVEGQNGCCAICGTRAKTLRVDHDHETGRVRELLCGSCNTGVRSLDRLEAFMAYVQRHRAIADRWSA